MSWLNHQPWFVEEERVDCRDKQYSCVKPHPHRLSRVYGPVAGLIINIANARFNAQLINYFLGRGVFYFLGAGAASSQLPSSVQS